MKSSTFRSEIHERVYTLRVVSRNGVQVSPGCGERTVWESPDLAAACSAAARLALALSHQWDPYDDLTRQLAADARETLCLFGADAGHARVDVVESRRVVLPHAHGDLCEVRTRLGGERVLDAIEVAEVVALGMGV